MGDGPSSLVVQRPLLFQSMVHSHPKSEETAVYLPKATLQSLPVEILLHIFSQLELKPYLFSRGVCKEWQRLLPLADIHPAWLRLAEFYLKMVNTPDFIDTRTWIIDNLQPFDRQAYINILLSQYPAVPEEFRIWLLEWPERATVNCIWPGLPFISCTDFSPRRRSGVYWVAYKKHSPQLLAPVYRQHTPYAKFVPGLLIWRRSHLTEWLIFDEDEPELFGRVYVTSLLELEKSGVIPHERQKIPDDDDELEEAYDEDADGYLNVPFPDWIAYLESCWAENVRRLERRDTCSPLQDRVMPESDMTPQFNSSYSTKLPAVPWSLRESCMEYLMID
ncbi:hypothetical protein JR316_0001526 [Psilocybe cubensis]|uniref:Uncharacterized protein n=2 Tax=Psilocybe cubensis TaxID=181762 RepID=A0ACB8HHE8_PSICU|nr:hypothetical protein JR316_0001526 [Psilocybe cubensis]KAH9487450.1 hypothetical protein JR316_0001526 [Psilocybe cubensis]